MIALQSRLTPRPRPWPSPRFSSRRRPGPDPDQRARGRSHSGRLVAALGEPPRAGPLSLPHIPGVDAAGIVDELGDGVLDVPIGDPVFGLTPTGSDVTRTSQS